MRITLLAVLSFMAIGALLVYAGYELGRTQEKPQSPPIPPMPPLPSDL